MTKFSGEVARANLNVANAVRISNAELTRSLKARSYREGLLHVAALLRGDVKGPAGAIPTGRLLRAIRWMSTARTHEVAAAAHVYDLHRPVRRLTERQRHELAHVLEDRASWRRRQP